MVTKTKKTEEITVKPDEKEAEVVVEEKNDEKKPQADEVGGQKDLKATAEVSVPIPAPAPYKEENPMCLFLSLLKQYL